MIIYSIAPEEDDVEAFQVKMNKLEDLPIGKVIIILNIDGTEEDFRAWKLSSKMMKHIQ